jgi:uncharacterized protein (TIGR00299 family) protein
VKLLYLECNMGAAGDMLMSALYELCHDKDNFIEKMNSLLPDISVSVTNSTKCGITGSRVLVEVSGAEEISEDVDLSDVHNHSGESGYNHNNNSDSHDHVHSHSNDHTHSHSNSHDATRNHSHSHHVDADHTHDSNHHHSHDNNHHEHSIHQTFEGISSIISGMDLPDKVKNDAIAVYRILAEAESHAHGSPVEQIHFHEVGTLDAVADIVGVCLLFHLIAPDCVKASPIHVGTGNVRCAHGILPVPAPATAHILRGVPIYSGSIRGELCTPTGAALLKYFVDEFSAMPPMTVESIGYGMGKKDFPAANCVRAFIGEAEGGNGGDGDEIFELSCNLDDMTPEAIGHAVEKLFSAGALDVFSIPIQMKKNRPAVLLTCLCRPADEETLTRMLLTHTTTIGVRKKRCSRTILNSTAVPVQTSYGEVRIKISRGHGIEKHKPEFEDLRRAAEEHGVTLEEVYRAALSAYDRL